jgi:hypothetical protein
MKKTLDAANIVNELRGQSAFFPPRPAEQTHQADPQPQQETKSSTPVRDVPPVLPVRPEPPERAVRPVPLTKRFMKQRHPFDIYHDQYETLKQLADEDRRQGGMGSMSAMVREAIDTFIAAKRRKRK